VQPEVIVGQRFLKALTVDLVGALVVNTDNSSLSAPGAMLKQNPTYGFEGSPA
jgi:hypothetical protein